MKVAIVGVGYVGLVTGSCLAEVGNTVTCVDINEEKIKDLNNGIIPIYEPGLDSIVKNNIIRKQLQFTTNISEALKNCQIIIIAVGTPAHKDGSSDILQVLKVAKTIGSSIEDYRLVVIKSTVPVGTANKVKKVIQESLDARSKNIEFSVASNPEFLKQGTAISDFLKPDRIVIGCDDTRAKKLLTNLYSYFIKNGFPNFHYGLAFSRILQICLKFYACYKNIIYE